MIPSGSVFMLLVAIFLFYTGNILYLVLRKKFGYLIIGFCVYHSLFMLGPALVHSYFNVYPFYQMSYSEDEQLAACIALALFSISFFLGFYVARPVDVAVHGGATEHVLHPRRLLFCVTIMLGVTAAIILSVGADVFMVKRNEFSLTFISNNASIAALLIGFARSSAFIALLLLWHFRKSIGPVQWAPIFIFSLAIFSIVNFPLALPRYILFSYVLAILYIYSAPTVRNKALLFISFLFGLTTVFPYASFLTRGRTDEYDLSVVSYFKNSGDFDGFQSLINVIKYTVEAGYSYGYQALGALLIFVPRSIWTSKPIATGNIAAESVGYDFVNVSSPLVSELFVDFGWLGVTLFSVFLGVVYRKIDSYFLVARLNQHYIGVFMGGILFSFTIIILRGTLIGIIANVMVGLLVAWVVLKYSFVRRKLSPLQLGK